jgi:hypothetical protein
MEKSKIIDAILNEWAMRSPDGLSGGHSKEENIEALDEILLEHDFSYDDIHEIMTGIFGEAEAEKQAAKRGRKKGSITKKFAPYQLFKDKNNPKIIRVYNRDKQKFDYADGTIYPLDLSSDIRRTLKTDTEDNINKARAALNLEVEKEWKGMRNQKHVSAGNVDRMRGAIEKYEDDTGNYSAVTLFKSKYDYYPMEKIQDAMDLYSGTSRDGKLVKDLIEEIDEGTAHAPTGRGEMVFVYILKGMTSGGNQMMDLVIAEARPDVSKYGREQGIEVKEATNKAIGISLPTLKGYTNSEFYKAITELINLVHRFGDNMLRSVIDILDKAVEDNTKKETYKNEILAFFEDPKSGEISMDLIKALMVVSAELSKNQPEKKDGVMDIEIGGEETEFDIKNVDKVKQDIDAAKTRSNDNVRLDVVAKYSRSMPTEDMEVEMKKIRFFKEQITPAKIDDMVVKLMTDKYSKLLVVDKSKSAAQRATLYDLSTMNQLKFGYLGFGKLYLMLPGATESDIEASKKDVKTTQSVDS